ncbi:alpha/beta hydrolase family protein [Sphingomicrobium lutaoense]|uniref:Dipeptidyl aminopeptidase/acylaminoacyl peptidase n=1 Tax=Sphingomicrobium lutaoense TaxID=515949 RepID=A0A839YVN6_9SPHN|nr:S9 family peptidase [Sphingomicrobium lutaoense]MBB3763269.1 dipeptidyl aminopeptidase/acylaminoacyl peptidase [Sphingomicrobium lutaoense]
MKKLIALTALAATTFLVSPAAAREMTPEDLVKMKRMGAPSVSPDGAVALFSLSSAKEDLAGRETSHLLHSLETGATVEASELDHYKPRGARFGGDGAVWFVSAHSGTDQVYRMMPGEPAVQVSALEGGSIDDFVLAPNVSSVVLVATRDIKCADFECANVPAPEKGDGVMEYDEIFVRHWDSWVEPGMKSRLFGYRIENGKMVGGKPLDRGLDGNTPSRPFGGIEEIDIAPGGEAVFFAQRAGGRTEPTSTNLDIYYAPIDGSMAPYNLTATNKAHDNLPAVSPDGQTLAYVAMARPGYESDRLVVHLRDLKSGNVRALTADWDASVGSLEWTPDSRALIVGVGETLEHPLYRIDVATGQRTRLTGKGNASSPVALPDGRILFTMNSLEAPSDLYLYSAGRIEQRTHVNKALLDELDPIEVETFTFKGADGDTVWGYRLKPADHEGKLPVAFVVHGGPQGSFGNLWSSRWNSRMLSAPGYGVVSIDFHGSTGYGQDFTDSINQDWGGKPLEDLKLGLAHALEMDDQLAGDRICALGASYGGYMMNWIAGKWPERFNCLINHNGLFDTRSFYYSTEELWFPEHDFGGPYFLNPESYEKWNPVNHVDQWQTPMMVVLGLKDYRVPYSQGLGAFTALQRRGIPSKLLVFPDENHWVLNGRNSVRWHQEVFDWMDRWTAKDE